MDIASLDTEMINCFNYYLSL